MKKKLFISQPMRGLSEKEIKKERLKLVKIVKRELKLKDEDFEVIDSLFTGDLSKNKPLWFLGESLKKLSQADIVIFGKGWEAARGCRIEYHCAVDYEIDKILMYDFMEKKYIIREKFMMPSPKKSLKYAKDNSITIKGEMDESN